MKVSGMMISGEAGSVCRRTLQKAASTSSSSACLPFVTFISAESTTGGPKEALEEAGTGVEGQSVNEGGEPGDGALERLDARRHVLMSRTTGKRGQGA
jgi:hypothetical protein